MKVIIDFKDGSQEIITNTCYYKNNGKTVEFMEVFIGGKGDVIKTFNVDSIRKLTIDGSNIRLKKQI